jgi:hypothetical protein
MAVRLLLLPLEELLIINFSFFDLCYVGHVVFILLRSVVRCVGRFR